MHVICDVICEMLLFWDTLCEGLGNCANSVRYDTARSSTVRAGLALIRAYCSAKPFFFVSLQRGKFISSLASDWLTHFSFPSVIVYGTCTSSTSGQGRVR